ncbi:large ribosomal subunit protein bL19m-like [Amphiura filiformis]|uniref:large ribosomal subunit protein bL19m-like n=1 Tax=Amphiura filiformis TaxID=82378 RepID=UPI003B210F95
MAAYMARVWRTGASTLVRKNCLTPCLLQRLASTDIPSDQSQDAADTTEPHSSQPKRRMRKMRLSSKDGSEVSQDLFISPELMPPMGRRYRLLDYMSRLDCYRRRMVVNIPEFYVGSIIAVTVSDPYSKGKTSRFVGICIKRQGYGIGASIRLRNHVNGEGVEICYMMYNPLITKIECLKLEKRPDDHLLYLRDALPEYSTIDFNMNAIKHPPGKAVPVNDIKVKMKPKPWYMKWERKELQGIDFSILPEEKLEHAKKWWKPEHTKMDILQRWELPDDYTRQIEWEVTQHEREKRRAADQGR